MESYLMFGFQLPKLYASTSWPCPNICLLSHTVKGLVALWASLDYLSYNGLMKRVQQVKSCELSSSTLSSST